jgi:hypothetical protein
MTVINVKVFVATEQRANILQDPVFKAALTATPAQIDAYLLANLTNIAQARTFVALLLRGMVYLVNQQRA